MHKALIINPETYLRCFITRVDFKLELCHRVLLPAIIENINRKPYITQNI